MIRKHFQGRFLRVYRMITAVFEHIVEVLFGIVGDHSFVDDLFLARLRPPYERARLTAINDVVKTGPHLRVNILPRFESREMVVIHNK
ncbi:hypothetical protein D3C87_1858600 [compost metagenome]